ncbi:MAG: 6,7-dimethyl-8-ribityllumazine synthase, partial [Candidatus Pacebacteria bacterium]|nr:6,7-dimethyl-8-ribityllumazine synthase [Candidatus Paceibacterota bacterium]
GEALLSECLKTLNKGGVNEKQISIFKVTGALEIPLVAKKIAKTKRYDAIIVFGVVLKGKTYHFEQVSDECARGCMQVAYDYEIPVIFQVLSVYKEADAVARTKGTKDNRGIEAGKTALEMIEVMKKL